LRDVSQGGHGKLLPILVGFGWTTTRSSKFMLELLHLGILLHTLIKADLTVPNIG
jgi:hypothetical protein